MTHRDPSVVHQHDPQLPRMRPPQWVRRRYDGGPYDQRYHTCSYCGCIHPADLLELIRAGGVRIEGTSKSYKRYFHIPNPIAGRSSVSGRQSGPIHYVGATPRGVVARMLGTVDRARSGIPDGHRVGLLQRLEGTWKRDIRSAAPSMIMQKFYMEHVTREEWDEIVGEYKAAEVRAR